MSQLQLLHIFATGPLLIYVGVMKPSFVWIYWLLGLIGGYVLLSFAYKSWTTALGERHVWFAVHGILFALLLMYVGWKTTCTPHVVYSLLLAVGIAAFGYHFLRMVQKILFS